MLFTKQYVTNSRVAKDHYKEVTMMRNANNISEKMHAEAMKAHGFKANAGQIPADVYKEFDNVTVERMRADDGDTFLNDLMPLAKSVNIGKLVYETRRASSAGQVQTSMGGQQGVKMDQVEYNYDGVIVPVHDAGFSRNWRELAAQKSEGFDALIDDQRETVASLRAHLADSFMDGHTDVDGNNIVMNGYSWAGIRSDSRVQSVDLGAGGVNFDFTDNANTGDQNKNALITTLDYLWITNNCAQDVTVYVSREIARNWERNFSTNYDGRRIIDQLSGLQGVASIKVSNKLTGNQLMAFPLDAMRVKPIVGMEVATIALPRPLYNSDHQFVTAAALGWFVGTDHDSKTCALYASE